MNLESVFNEYIKVNKDYITFVNEVINKNFENYTEEEIMGKLVEGKNNFEKLMEAVNLIEVEEENGLYLKDVKYSLVDGLFLSIDLYNFYNSKELERFKMRGVNYIRKGRVTSFF